MEKRCVVFCYRDVVNDIGNKVGKFDSHYRQYIEKLRDGVNQHTTINPDIFVISNVDLSDIEGIKQINVDGNQRAWHIRNQIFYPNQFNDYAHVLYIDLDTIITNNIDNILNDDSDFLLHYDVGNKNKQLQYGAFSFNPHLEFIKSGEMFEEIQKDNLDPKSSSALVFNNFLKSKGVVVSVMQDKGYLICSYKCDIVTRKRDANNYQILMYHGKPAPHETNWSLVRPLTPQERNRQRRDEKVKEIRQKQLGVTKSPKEPKKQNVPYCEVPLCYENQDVFIIGGGPSLKRIDLDKFLMEKNVIGVNDAYEFKCTKMLFYGDCSWFRVHQQKVEEITIPIYSINSYSKKVNKLCPSTSTIHPKIRNKIIWCGNSGDAAICLALLTGAKRIYLLGFDRGAISGETNWHKNIRKVSGNSYVTMNKRGGKFLEAIRLSFPDVEIINIEMVSGGSSLEIYPKVLFNELFKVDREEIYMSEEEWNQTKNLKGK